MAAVTLTLHSEAGVGEADMLTSENRRLEAC
jgi:hypothetical protein